jgi:two-component system, chemotaxis family, CheB/CheR fusion protein
LSEVGGNGSNGHAHPNPELVVETDYSPPRGNPFPVVGIGASAGGLEAFAQLLAAVPEDTGVAFVLVQHLDPQHQSLLSELLAPATRMPVVTVSDDIEIRPNHVYVIPPNTSMELADGHLRLAAREPGLHLPIDIFFRSLANVQGSRAIGVVLSGNASDGSLGVRAIKAECGITFAQDEATASFGGMPRNAVATGAIDYVLPPAEIGREIGRLGNHRFLVTPEPGVAEAETLPEGGDGDLKRILAMLQAGTKVDFAQYKPTTIQRRIGRRMMILRIESLPEYARYLQQKPSELYELYRDLLISVTSFFRDPATFDALMQHLPAALEGREGRDGAIRVWVSGCATGEEVYSLAISLHEYLQDRQLSLPIQMFGTDISEQALQRARQGIYGAIIADDVSESRLRRFFTKVETGYQINKMIREACVFARHDVTRDPPFSRLDVVSCRNVLIYLDARAQRRVLPTFHYALNPTGLLLLGTAETTGAASDLFSIVDKKHHIYMRKPVPTRLILDLTAGPLPPEYRPAPRVEPSGGADIQRKLDRLIQDKYSPDAVVINAEMQIIHFRGHTAQYLDPTPGEASLNVMRMAKEGLVLPLRRAVQRAADTDAGVRESGIFVPIDGRAEHIALEVTPIAGATAAERCFLVVFVRSSTPETPPPAEDIAVPAAPVDQQVAALQQELLETREYLRYLTEQYEAHSEELRAANEESRSANEELQSTNEELGTTKEELQSANEELTTVNEELQGRNQEMTATNSDLRNLLAAVPIAIVMVDDDLRVRRFNPAAEKLLELGSHDLGRPVGHLRGPIETPQLEEKVRGVVESLTATAEEVRDKAGCWHLIRIRPYRTVDDRIAGAIISFQDIDALKRGLEASEEARQYAEALIETVREPLVVLDGDLRVQRATAAFYEMFLVSREETEGRLIYDLGNGQWNRPRLRELLGAALFRSEPFHDFEVEHEFPNIGLRTMRLNARRIPRQQANVRTLLLAIEDVTERREIAEIRFRRLFETAKDGMVVIDDEAGCVQDVNPFLLKMTGLRREDIVGRSVREASALVGLPLVEEIVAATGESEIVRRDDLQLKGANGVAICVDVLANRYLVGSQPVVQLNIRDIAPRKEAVKALRASEEQFRLVVESVRDYAIFQLDEEGKVRTWNPGAERLLGWSEHEIVGRSASVVFTPEDVAAGEDRRELETARAQGRADDERWHIRKDGSRFYASGVLTRGSGLDGSSLTFTKVMQDVTGRKMQEEQLRRSLEEKKTLLREMHHRVKNNLQMIVSLLSLQSSHIADPVVLHSFEEAKGRVRAIAQIHEQLYASDDLREVEVGRYIEALAQELIGLHEVAPGGTKLEVEADEMVFPIEKAIPLGLIANELILNSLKHGLRERMGRLHVRLALLDNGDALLEVEDTGPGFRQGFDAAATTSMGYRLVNLLVRQLRARLELGNAPGARVRVTFPSGGY